MINGEKCCTTKIQGVEEGTIWARGGVSICGVREPGADITPETHSQMS